jgi:hypothetical protein
MSNASDLVKCLENGFLQLVKSWEKDGRQSACGNSVWKSGLKTGKRPEPDRDQTAVRSFSSYGLSTLRMKDRKKTGLNEPVLTGIL